MRRPKSLGAGLAAGRPRQGGNPLSVLAAVAAAVAVAVAVVAVVVAVAARGGAHPADSVDLGG
jgi:hypothetical protein